jgi:glycosyltransferase involved in cell wall biosynthesis
MWISLKTDKVQLRAVIPLRLQSYMSAEKPIIGVGEGSIVQLVKDADCGFVASNAKELSSYLRTELLHNSNRLHKMGLNGRNYFEKNFEKNICINNLCEIINDK